MMAHRFCQSCGVPFCERPDEFGGLDPKEDFCFAPGKETDGTPNQHYCSYCYKDGAFVHPDRTVKDMQEACVRWLEGQGIRRCKAEFMVETLPSLDRWTGE